MNLAIEIETPLQDDVRVLVAELNVTLSELTPPEFCHHLTVEQMAGYQQIFGELEQALCAITGFAAVSLQPNSGAQGEYAGLMVIRAYHRDRGDTALVDPHPTQTSTLTFELGVLLAEGLNPPTPPRTPPPSRRTTVPGP